MLKRNRISGVRRGSLPPPRRNVGQSQAPWAAGQRNRPGRARTIAARWQGVKRRGYLPHAPDPVALMLVLPAARPSSAGAPLIAIPAVVEAVSLRAFGRTTSDRSSPWSPARIARSPASAGAGPCGRDDIADPPPMCTRSLGGGLWTVPPAAYPPYRGVANGPSTCQAQNNNRIGWPRRIARAGAGAHPPPEPPGHGRGAGVMPPYPSPPQSGAAAAGGGARPHPQPGRQWVLAEAELRRHAASRPPRLRGDGRRHRPGAPSAPAPAPERMAAQPRRHRPGSARFTRSAVASVSAAQQRPDTPSPPWPRPQANERGHRRHRIGDTTARPAGAARNGGSQVRISRQVDAMFTAMDRPCRAARYARPASASAARRRMHQDVQPPEPRHDRWAEHDIRARFCKSAGTTSQPGLRRCGWHHPFQPTLRATSTHCATTAKLDSNGS